MRYDELTEDRRGSITRTPIPTTRRQKSVSKELTQAYEVLANPEGDETTTKESEPLRRGGARAPAQEGRRPGSGDAYEINPPTF